MTRLKDWHRPITDIATRHLGADGAHDLAHLERVWTNARHLMEQHPEADRLVVLAACFLHDLVNLPKDSPERAQASRRSADLARAELAREGFPESLLDGVVHAIEAHSFSGGVTPDTIEAKIVQDADRLDALGIVGLARMFYTAGRMGAAIAHPSDPLGAQRTLDDKAFALDHIKVKLAQLPALMHTAAAREMAADRMRQLEGFRDAFAEEWTGKSIG